MGKIKTFIQYAIFICLLGLTVFTVEASRTDNLVPVQKAGVGFSGCNFTDLYLSEQNDGDNLSDYGLFLNENFRLQGKVITGYEAGQISKLFSYVSYYTPLDNMLYKIYQAPGVDPLNGTTGIIDNNTFYRATRVFPYNTPIRSFATDPDKIVFEAPSDADTNKNSVSIKYSTVYSYAVGTTNTTSAYRYNLIPDINYFNNAETKLISTLPGSYANTTRLRSTLAYTKNSCRTFDMHRCGDGYTDISTGRIMTGKAFEKLLFFNTFTGEVCDDGALNGTDGYCPAGCGIGGGSCGDGITQEDLGEECDAGVNNGSDMCTIECVLPVIDVAVDEAVNE